jgi:DNA-binding response OmpR family regulator
MTLIDQQLKTVLVVEDDPWMSGMLCTLLAGEGYAVTEAATGKQGFQLAARDVPDVVLLDLIMPGESGLDVLHRLKDSAATCNIPVIVVSGHTKTIQANAAGRADGLIQKPFDLVELLGEVRRATQTRQRSGPIWPVE